jgi:two-component system response regulator HydG
MPVQQVRRILIVDDEKTLVHLLAQNFLTAPEDYEVVTVGSAEEAIELLYERPFGVVIADMVLPKMSGLELLERVRLMQPEAHVIVMSAYGTDEVRERASELGAFEYLEKPFPFAELKRVVVRAFGEAPEARTQPDEGEGACTQ